MKYIILLTDKEKIYEGYEIEYWLFDSAEDQTEASKLAEVLKTAYAKIDSQLESVFNKVKKQSSNFYTRNDSGCPFLYSKETKNSELTTEYNNLIALSYDIKSFYRRELDRDLTAHEKELILSLAESELESLPELPSEPEFRIESATFNYRNSDIPEDEWDTCIKASIICFPFKQDFSWDVL